MHLEWCVLWNVYFHFETWTCFPLFGLMTRMKRRFSTQDNKKMKRSLEEEQRARKDLEKVVKRVLKSMNDPTWDETNLWQSCAPFPSAAWKRKRKSANMCGHACCARLCMCVRVCERKSVKCTQSHTSFQVGCEWENEWICKLWTVCLFEMDVCVRCTRSVVTKDKSHSWASTATVTFPLQQRWWGDYTQNPRCVHTFSVLCCKTGGEDIQSF